MNIEHTRWLADNGEAKRLEYDLNEDSIVIDAGGYKGEWAEKIHNKYGCYVFIFEPVASFYLNIKNKFKDNDKIYVFNFGLGGYDRTEMISSQTNDSASIITGEGTEHISIVDIVNVMNDHKLSSRVDLMKINIEGMEYELLERLIDSGLVNSIKNIQVQFHDFVPDAEKRRDAIVERLKETHLCDFSYTFIWEGWSKTAI